MSKRPFEVVRLDEIEPTSGVEGSQWLRIRARLGIGAFGANAYRADAGGRVIEEHDELGSSAGRHEELYFVHSGHAKFTIAGDEVDAPAGTFVFVGPDERRGAIAQEDGTTVLVIGGKRGEAFSVSPWEEGAEAYDLWETKEFARAAEILRGVVERHPQAWSVYFNLACAESLSGQTDAALEHLRLAVENDERMREHAKTDPDLDPIRDDPRFPML